LLGVARIVTDVAPGETALIVVRILVSIYAVLCVLAIAIIPLSQEALAGIYAIVLALPWFWLFSLPFPDPPTWLAYAFVIVSMLINGTILWRAGRNIAGCYSSQ
jgi:hypothetical protein